MEFQVITWSVSDPFGTLWEFATKNEAVRFISELAKGIHAKLLEL